MSVNGGIVGTNVPAVRECSNRNDAGRWYLGLPLLNLLNTSALNFSISSGVNTVTVSCGGKSSLF